jgi:hypothetical protein
MTQDETHKISLDRLLECGVILNWEALMQTATSSIQVDYRLGLNLSLDYLRVLDRHNQRCLESGLRRLGQRPESWGWADF